MTEPRVSSNQKKHATGSPSTGEPVFILIGRLRSSHGVIGEISMLVDTDFPERLNKGKMVFVGKTYIPMTIEHTRLTNNGMLIKFVGVENSEEAKLLRNSSVYVKFDELPQLPEGTYYHHQLLGLKVLDSQSRLLGILTEILETGANDVYVVTSDEGVETLLPVVESVIVSVDLEKGEMRVNPPEWS
jgi:16S rRNA processing protein RimM